ncbi:MAG: S8 family peptidase [Promethearchaeota archaeon]
MFEEEKMKELEERDKKLEEETNRFIVILEPKHKKNLRAAVNTLNLQEFGIVKHVHSLIPAVTIEAQETKGPQLAKLASMRGGEVKEVIKDRRLRIMLDVSVPLIQAPKVWKQKDEGKGVVVAVVDTGVDKSHPDLKDRVVNSEDFTGEGYFDGHGHGTHVAGIIAGDGSASSGKYKGVAPKATIIAAKVLDTYGSGWASDIIAGVEWAVEQGAKILNLSLGGSGPCDGTDIMSKACDAAVDAGTVVCVAAGNSGPDPSTVGTPGCAHKVITVGASDDNDKIAWFSSRGPTSDGRVKPDVCFPGFGIVSARAKNTSMGSPEGEYYTQASGTSMATPHTAGVAALLIAEYENRKKRYTNEDIKRLILDNAHDLGYDNNTEGHGRGDAFASWEDIIKSEERPQEAGGFSQSTGIAAFIGAIINVIVLMIAAILVFGLV